MSCHGSTGNHDSRLAPPVKAIQNHYGKWYDQEDEFVDAIVQFVLEPKEEKARMRGALHRFGLMPKQAFDSVEVRKIAQYLYTMPTSTDQKHQRGKHQKKLDQG